MFAEFSDALVIVDAARVVTLATLFVRVEAKKFEEILA